MQVASRFLLVWGVLFLYPYLAVQSPTYSSMLIAWSVTEVIRYSYFALTLSGVTPRILTWLRYNTFFLLYPIGILSECSLVYLAAVGPAATATEYPLDLMPYVLYGILAIYVPGMLKTIHLPLREVRSGKRKKKALTRCLRRRICPLHTHDDPEKKGPAQLEGQERKGDSINDRIQKVIIKKGG
jgi:hypothetical protein